jgi:hypothetical protein
VGSEAFDSVAEVPTDAAARYAKQLLSHLGHKVTMEPLEDEPLGGRLVFAYASATVIPTSDRLTMRATAPDAESLARVQDVLKRHLEKFGARRELVVEWRSE